MGVVRGSLCSLAIALWGWQTGLWLLAIPMALALEARHIIRQRWNLSLDDLKSTAKLCGVILAILFVVLLSLERSLFIYALLQWLPVAAFPLVVAQTYGTGVLELLRDWFSNPHLLKMGIRRKRNPLNLHYLYFAVCVLAASAANAESYLFYGVATGVIAIFLWTLRPRRSTPIVWVLLVCLSAGLGFVGHVQLSQFQDRLEDQLVSMLSELVGGAIDAERNTTRMGTVGKLKLSSRIAFRVSAEADAVESIETESVEASSSPSASKFPLLLREATYNQYRLSNWIAESSEFLPVNPSAEVGSWMLEQPNLEPNAEQAKPQSTITVSTNLKQGKGILTLPAGTTALRQLPVETMQRNQYGTVRVSEAGNVAYEVQFENRDGEQFNAVPTEADLQIPQANEMVIAQVLQSLNLDESHRSGKSDRDIANQIAAYFQTFDYSLDLIRPDQATTPLADFLLNTQAGHCEYFATATTLLLRGAGIPARYAVGYSVHEFSPLERQYIVRSRDAHAWTLAYLDGRWQTLDTTPPDWTAQEREMASPFQAVSDFFAFLGFQLGIVVRWFQQLGTKGVLIVALPLLGYLLWRSLSEFRGRERGVSVQGDEESDIAIVQAGLDSEFYSIEQLLSELGIQRLPSESLMQWGERLRWQLPVERWNDLQPILYLHYRYRFDPQGLTDTDRQQLAALSQAWVQKGLPLEPFEIEMQS